MLTFLWFTSIAERFRWLGNSEDGGNRSSETSGHFLLFCLERNLNWLLIIFVECYLSPCHKINHSPFLLFCFSSNCTFVLFMDEVHYATVRKFAGSIPDGVIGFFNWPNPSSRIMALGSTQPLTEMSTRNLPGGKGWPAHKADKLTAVCKSIV
jgi:hypothetical protein